MDQATLRASRLGRGSVFGGSGGGGLAGFRQLLTLDSESLSDPSGLIGSGGWSNTLSRLNVTLAAHTTNAPGYQSTTGFAWQSVAFATLPGLESFDPDEDDLQLGIQCDTFALGTTGVGIVIGVADSDTVATRNAVSLLRRQSTGTSDAVGYQNATSQSFAAIADNGPLPFVYGHISLCRTSTNSFVASILPRAENAAGNRGAPNGNAGNTLTALSRLFIGVNHGATGSPVGLNIVARFGYRRVPRSAIPFALS